MRRRRAPARPCSGSEGGHERFRRIARHPRNRNAGAQSSSNRTGSAERPKPEIPQKQKNGFWGMPHACTERKHDCAEAAVLSGKKESEIGRKSLTRHNPCDILLQTKAECQRNGVFRETHRQQNKLVLLVRLYRLSAVGFTCDAAEDTDIFRIIHTLRQGNPRSRNFLLPKTLYEKDLFQSSKYFDSREKTT